MEPLRINVEHYGTPESNGWNITSALARKLPELTPALCAHDGTFVVVGSGPSLPSFAKELKRERTKGRPICAVKGAHDYLCEQGLDPDLFICVDPRDRSENIKHKNQNTIYLLASRCAPEMFNALQDHKIILWHSFGVEAEQAYYKGHASIGGGSTSGMRAITIGYILGYRKFKLFGMDSCLAADKLTKRFTGEQAGQVVGVQVGEREFFCNGAMAQQANEFQELYSTYPGISIESIGDGLLTAIIAERKKQGLPA